MEPAMHERIRRIWAELEDEPESTVNVQKRKYRRLDLEKETGLRLSCCFPGRLLELLVEIGPHSKRPDYPFPNFKGMSFDLIQLDAPASGTWHICLRLENAEHTDVFISVCSDLAEELQTITTPQKREEALLDFMERWSRFFEKHGLQGLTDESQRGLFGELWWMRRLLDAGIPAK